MDATEVANFSSFYFKFCQVFSFMQIVSYAI